MAREIRNDPRMRALARGLGPLALGLFLAAVLVGARGGGAARGYQVACLAGVGACFLVAAWPLFHYRCPRCGLRVRGRESSPPDPDGAVRWLRVCPRCDVAWDIGWGHGGKVEGGD